MVMDSRISERKWAEKQARQDAMYGGRVGSLKTLQSKARDLSAKANAATSNGSAIGTGYFAGRQAQAQMGEAHLAAASAHREAAQRIASNPSASGARSLISQNYALKEAASHTQAATVHMALASDHAANAGDAWDEDKHPRDENGKFA